MTKILNKSQAEALYAAMCSLNHVGGRLSVVDLGPQPCDPQVRFTSAGLVIIERGRPHCDREVHDNQSAFVAAYGLQQG